MREPGPSDRVEVAVVGFGPAGAVATAMLGQSGIRTLAVDRETGVYDKPRAIAIDHEILRHLDNLGMADDVLPHVAPFPASQHFGAQGQLIRRIDMVPEPYPQAYVPTMVFSQPPVEAAMRAHARAHPSVEVALGTALLDLAQDEAGVTLRLRGPAGDRTVRADYVVACDGASSGVRGMLGIELDDLVFDEPWLVVDLLVNADALGKLPETAAQFCDPARPTTFIVGPDNHRRFEIMLLPGEDPRLMQAPEGVWRLLARWLTPDDAVLWRAASYRFHALVARDWRRGRVFLAGDAAHQQPPFIGQGMCQGLRDVTNLAWKLERVLRGRSGDALLDSYGAERGAHVRALTARIKAIGQVICERDPDRARERDARLLAEGGGHPRTITRQEIVPPLTTGLLAARGAEVREDGAREDGARGTLFPQPWIVTAEGPRRLDALTGTGWRLVLDARAAPDVGEAGRGLDLRTIAIAPAQGPDGALVERDGVVAAWFDRHGCRAAIVRPAHYVYGTARDADALTRLVAELAARLAPAANPTETVRTFP